MLLAPGTQQHQRGNDVGPDGAPLVRRLSPRSPAFQRLTSRSSFC